MPDRSFAGVDHVHRAVPDLEVAVEWYERVFGFERAAEFDSWAEGTGPLVIATPERTIGLALFTGDPPGDVSTVAFDTDAEGFLRFVDNPETPVERGDVIDHQLSYSVYLSDPWGYDYEVTTYDYDTVAEQV